MSEKVEADQWSGLTLRDRAGRRIGRIRDVYADPVSHNLEWATVKPRRFDERLTFVPLAGALGDGDDVRVHVTKRDVRAAPRLRPAGGLSTDDERALFVHYRIPMPDDLTAVDAG
jgi:hypothetical protein